MTSAADPSSPSVLQATREEFADQPQALTRARNFAEPLLMGATLDTGESVLAHADGTADILRVIGGSEAMQAASYLVYASEYLNKPQEVIAKAFGDAYAELAMATARLIRVQRQARAAALETVSADVQTDNVRKMLLAFSRDLRVVLLRLASRLQTMRHYAASKQPVPRALASESLHVFAPLANRLGIWQIKWEMEDLAFRFLEPDTYKQVARWLDEKRTEREHYIEHLRVQVQEGLRAQGIQADVQGRPKHIYSIVKKMRGKSLSFDRVFDVRALRIVVPTVADCYGALSWIHTQFSAVTEEFDDYIARPKPNGYQSLHTVVRDDQDRAIEVQIRTRDMHDHAEHGVAAHWAYKEAGTKGYSGVSASAETSAKMAVLRQLLAWERDLAGAGDADAVEGGRSAATTDAMSDRIYVLTPNAAVVELPREATPIDFAYALHTDLGHRCRGARIDGVMVPLHTRLQNGQTVEINTVKEGGPSRDWLNPELGFLVSSRARAKVRAWFNAQAMQATMARGREAVEKLLQREGKTAIKLEDLASQLGFKSADALFEVVGKDEFSLRNIEVLLHPQQVPMEADDYVLLKKSRPTQTSTKGGVLVVGMDSLLTQLARCCKPAPPDDIVGYVTRGKGVSIHRADCASFQQMVLKDSERVIDVTWGQSQDATHVYPVDVAIEAFDRQGLLRDISEVFAKEKMNVIGVQTHSIKDMAYMTFTVEVGDSRRLQKVLTLVRDVSGVRAAKRR
jgi:GTP pyrophosphokinase